MSLKDDLYFANEPRRKEKPAKRKFEVRITELPSRSVHAITVELSSNDWNVDAFKKAIAEKSELVCNELSKKLFGEV